MKPIPSLPGYWATDQGEIIGPRGKPLSQFWHSDYLRVQAGGKQKIVSRLICEAYHGAPPSEKHHAAHLDGDKSNNNQDNLAWKTHIENMLDNRVHGTFRGVNHPRAAFTEEEILSIRTRRNNGERVREIHKDYPNVSYSTIVAITTRRNWSHVPVHSRDEPPIRVG